ncbi:MAG: excinuclease ABC subunit UvrC [Ruminococcaceae bacterium]|nr:excinuclease ABC subunit UvrC [Oscillospiraceae bacterium]
MPKTANRFEELLEKANKLPSCPGVYIMKDKDGKIIYVGKSRKLKNRVSQYFQNSKKSFKTAKMVSTAEDFDYILCKTEIEALALENTLIKKHSPKYNIKLKDAKSYPYIKITSGAYPKIIFTRSRMADKATYFGPFTGVSTVYSILDTVNKALGLPTCKRSFPKDIGKERPCIYYQMGKCCGVCTGKVSSEEYGKIIECAADILKGHSKNAIQLLENNMFAYAENEQYESAARCRDTIKALQKLTDRQDVVASPDSNIDVFGLFSEDSFACISSMYIRDGALTNKNDFLISSDAITDSEALCAFLVEHYEMNSFIPKLIAISFELDNDDKTDLEAYLSHKLGSKVEIRRPERGHISELCKQALENAKEHVRQEKNKAQKDDKALLSLAELLALEVLPERIEAYDISNIGAENITAGMVVFKNGTPSKADYRSFNIKTVVGKPDDYSSMREALDRRFSHLKNDSNGCFSEYPDIILVDGGHGHVAVAKEVANKHGICVPIYGMVKDEFHKTRALCTEKDEINIAREQSVYMLIYKIQDEVHRFSVGKASSAKRKTFKRSSLENIDGIGPVKAKKLLKAMGTLAEIKNASTDVLERVDGITQTDAHNIYKYFHSNQKGERKK